MIARHRTARVNRIGMRPQVVGGGLAPLVATGTSTGVDLTAGGFDQVYRRVKSVGGAFTQIYSGLGSVTRKKDTTAVPGTVYDYYVAAASAPAGSNVDNAGVSDLHPGNLGFWKFDEASGDAADSSPAALALTNTGGVTYAAGILGNGAVFDSSGTKYLSRAVPAGITTKATLAFWVKFNSLSGNAGVFSLGSAGEIFLTRAGNNVNCGFGGLSNFGQSNFPVVLGAGVWIHVSLVYDGTQTGNANRLKLFVNGRSQGFSGGFGGTIPASVSPAGSLFWGYDPSVYAASLDGMLDEVGLWNVALTQAQAQALYLFGAPAAYPWGWYDDSAVIVNDTFAATDGTALVGRSPSPTNTRGLTWAALPGGSCDWVMTGNSLQEATQGGAVLDPGEEDYTITFNANIGQNMTYAAVEIRVRCVAFGDGTSVHAGLWNHNKYQGDCELLKLDPGEALLFSGGWAADRSDHNFVVKKRGNTFTGYVDNNQKWTGTTTLSAGTTRLGITQASPGSNASGAVGNRFEVRLGEQFPPYPLGLVGEP